MNQEKKISVLICDDSALIRSVLRKIIEKQPDLNLIDYARNGEEAVEKSVRLQPDVLILDVEMPKMDGITALKEITQKTATAVIILSSTTTEGAEKTFEAIENGAFDCIAKPKGMENLALLENELLLKIREASRAVLKKKRKETLTTHPFRPVAPPIVVESKTATALPREHAQFGFKAVAIGISTGGPKTIFEVLPKLPADLAAAVIVVQHMPAEFTRAYAQRINSRCFLPCYESEPGMEVKPGTIYVARGGYHLKLICRGDGRPIIRQTKEPQHLFMPSVDVMFNSVVELFKADTIGVLMTGMGWDGAEGMVKIVLAGGYTIAESEETAVVFGMPQEAIKRGGVRVVLPHYKIAAEIERAVREESK